MKQRCTGPHGKLSATIFCLSLFVLLPASFAQAPASERTFAAPPAQVEKALKNLQSSSGRLPVLDGFVAPGRNALDHYQRGYYQCNVQVTPAPSGGSLVRISAKITAWYADPDPTKSGYQVLASNGRIESDLLDRLEDAMGGKAVATDAPPPAKTPPAKPKAKTDSSSLISAPMPADTVRGEPIGELKKTAPASPFKVGTPAGDDAVASLETRKAVTDKHVEELTKQAKNLEEILRTQAHPTNLVAVRKANTPVLTSPSEGAKVLFQASAEDEFEVLDVNANWVHVRISGLSRGWIRRSSLEMDAAPSPQAAVSAKPVDPAPVANTSPFQVENEQIASFPGDWEPLRGKTVKIISVQKAGSAGTGSHAKLEFAKSMFSREYAELTKTSSTAAGLVLIFDSDDGGMLAATLPVLQQWKAGTLSDEAFWRRCYFDPPEMFTSSGQ
jgi:hypothetical protein